MEATDLGLLVLALVVDSVDSFFAFVSCLVHGLDFLSTLSPSFSFLLLLNISSPYFSIKSLRLKIRAVRVVIGVAAGVPSDDSEPSEEELGTIESFSVLLSELLRFSEIFGDDVVDLSSLLNT